MTEPTYTQKEMMEFHFKRFDEKLDDIKLSLVAQNVNSEKRFLKIEDDIDNIQIEQVNSKTFQAKLVAFGSLIALFGSTVLAFTLNKIF